MATTDLLRSNPRRRLMGVCLTMLIVLALATSMAVGSLYVRSAYYAPDHAVPSRANAGVMTLDNVDLEQAADLYRPILRLP